MVQVFNAKTPPTNKKNNTPVKEKTDSMLTENIPFVVGQTSTTTDGKTFTIKEIYLNKKGELAYFMGTYAEYPNLNICMLDGRCLRPLTRPLLKTTQIPIGLVKCILPLGNNESAVQLQGNSTWINIGEILFKNNFLTGNFRKNYLD